MSLIKKLAGETAIYGLSSILSRLLNYVILVPFFTRIFQTGEYGVVSEMYAYAGLLMVLFTYRMETTFFRFGSESGQLNRAFSTAAISLFLSTLVFVTVLIFFAQPIAQSIQYPDHPDYIIWFSLIIGLDALSAIPFARLRLENRPIRFALVKILSIVINIIFVFFFLKGCPALISQGVEWAAGIYDPDDRISYVFIANLFGSAGAILFLLPEYLKIELRFDGKLWRKMIGYTLPLVVVGIAAVVNQLINIPMLKALLPYDLEENLSQVGIYAACYKIAILMSLFIQAFNYAAEPFFFRNSGRTDAKIIYAQVAQAFALAGSLVFLGIMFYLELIQYFIGENYREGLAVVPILLLAFFALGLYYNFSIWFKLTDRTHFGATISLGGAFITISLNYLLIPYLGYLGSAYAALACYAAMAIGGYILGRKYYPVPYPIFSMVAYIGLAVVFYYGSQVFYSYFPTQLWLSVGINTLLLAAYIGLLYTIEKKAIRTLMANK